MIPTYEQRIADERRLLAALFLYPRAVDLDERAFLSPEHGMLFACIQQALTIVHWPAFDGRGFDDVALEVVVECVRLRGAEHDRIFKRFPARDGQLAAWARSYITTTLMAEQVTAHVVDDLVEIVRACPRCGK